MILYNMKNYNPRDSKNLLQKPFHPRNGQPSRPMRNYEEIKKELEIKSRLEEIRKSIKAENISYSEIAELQSLAKYIDKNDIELLEWAGAKEYPKTFMGTVAGIIDKKNCKHKVFKIDKHSLFCENCGLKSKLHI